MKKTILIATLAMMTMATPLATADHCNGDVTVIGDVYVDVRGPNEVLVYQEVNARAGLQSGGMALNGAMWFMYDPCDHPAPDLLIHSPHIIF